MKTGMFSKRPTFGSHPPPPPSDSGPISYRRRFCGEQRFWPLKAGLDGEGERDARRRSDWLELRGKGIHMSTARGGGANNFQLTRHDWWVTYANKRGQQPVQVCLKLISPPGHMTDDLVVVAGLELAANWN